MSVCDAEQVQYQAVGNLWPLYRSMVHDGGADSAHVDKMSRTKCSACQFYHVLKCTTITRGDFIGEIW